ncbi:hypothetical protein DF19_25280 [Streptomyces olindensis]|nr:hypothetical protein DF19_25280 [Streptomyces olindensis]
MRGLFVRSSGMPGSLTAPDRSSDRVPGPRRAARPTPGRRPSGAPPRCRTAAVREERKRPRGPWRRR